MAAPHLSRRAFLKAGGALVVGLGLGRARVGRAAVTAGIIAARRSAATSPWPPAAG